MKPVGLKNGRGRQWWGHDPGTRPEWFVSGQHHGRRQTV
jgi:hypothetical protein